MPYTIGRLTDELRTIAGEWSSEFAAAKARMIVEEALTIFLTSAWPFNEGEQVITTRAPYSTGTVAVANNSAAVTLTGGTWSTSWTTPAIIRIDGSGGDAFLINTFGSSSTATLDKEWPYTGVTTSTYSIEFPAHEIGSYISVMDVTDARLAQSMRLRKGMFGRMLADRNWGPTAFWPGEYDIIPADGTNSQKIWLSPSPGDVHTIRYRFVKAVPTFRYYATGTVDVTNTGTGVAGTGTLWAKQGYSMAGQYLELPSQPNHQILIASVTTDTALVLTTGGYLGSTVSGAPYSISPAILCPDDLKPLLRAICRFLWARESKMEFAPAAQASYWQLRDQAIRRYNIGRDIGVHRPILSGEHQQDYPPPTPLVLRIE